MEALGFIVGLLYLYWEYQADMKVWIAGIIQPALSIYVYYEAGLYADFGINIYYLILALYGWVMWKYGDRLKRVRHKRDEAGNEKAELPITRMSLRNWGLQALSFALWFVIIGWILINFTNSNVPWWDSFTTAASIVGMWMLARKYLEQWWVWIAVDVVCAGLYVYKGIYFYATLYALYTVIAFFGYFKWRRLMRKTFASV